MLEIIFRVTKETRTGNSRTNRESVFCIPQGRTRTEILNAAINRLKEAGYINILLVGCKEHKYYI